MRMDLLRLAADLAQSRHRLEWVALNSTLAFGLNSQ